MPPMPPALGCGSRRRGGGLGIGLVGDEGLGGEDGGAATEAAFSSAVRQTLVGSTIPAAIISQYSSFAASKP